MRNVALQINHGTVFTGDGLRPVHPHTILGGLMTCHPPASLNGDLLKWVEASLIHTLLKLLVFQFHRPSFSLE